MEKPFKTYRQQLSILRSRNLLIPDGSKAIRILKKEGYYNIINGYKEIFLDTVLTNQHKSDYYKQGTTFYEIYSLYDFDRNIRLILLKYILKMETHLKTKVAYYFSEEFKQNFNYLDINNFDTSSPQKVTELIARISNVITKNTKKPNEQFYHYLDKHKELPLWVLVKKMSMGETINLYNNLKASTKKAIIQDVISEYKKEYVVNNTITSDQQEESISNMFALINIFRNICAHEERLYNKTVKDNKKKTPKIFMFHQKDPQTFTSKLFDCIIILGLFISARDYKKLVSDFEKEIIVLSKELPQNIFNQVLINMGFPKNWEKDIRLF